MAPYFILQSYLTYLFFIGSRISQQRLFRFFSVTFVIIIFIGFRYEVGGDWDSYIWYFEGISGNTKSFSGMKDFGYALTNYIVYKVGGSISHVNVACAIIVMLANAKIFTTQRSFWLATIVALPYYIIVITMGYTRQSVAISLVWLSYIFVLERHYFRGLLVIIIATMFHSTAILAIPVVILGSQLSRILKIALALIIMLIAYYFLATRFEYLVTEYLIGGLNSPGATFRLIIISASVLIIYFNYKNLPSLYTSNKLLIFISITSQVLWVVFYFSSTVADRLALYFFPLEIIALSNLPFMFKDSIIRGAIAILVVTASYILLLIWLLYANNSIYWLPYKFGIYQ